MAKISAQWTTVRIPPDSTTTWAKMRTALEVADQRIGDSTVYVIRTTKPFAIAYENLASPVMYIGEGDFSTRLKDHLKKWIQPLVKGIPTLTVEICFAKIKVRNNQNAYKDVEADLLHRFAERYGGVPLMNKQFEYHNRDHEYSRDFFKPIQSERGQGYLWALRPLISNMAYPASLKGLI